MAYRFVILGAGISGLTCAWYLKKYFGPTADITILEKSGRIGGCIRSIQSNDFFFEQGPRSLRTKGSGLYTLKLIEELGLQNQVIVADDQAHTRYLYSNRQLQKVPDGLFSFLNSPITRPLILPLLRECFVKKGRELDESIYSFIARRFNADIAESLIDPVVSGIYAGNIRNLSIKSCFPFLYDYEQTHGSIIKGMWKERKKAKSVETPFIQSIQKSALFSLQGGIETLVSELAKQMDVNIQLDTLVQSLDFHSSKITIHCIRQNNIQNVMEADYVFSTLSVNELEDVMRTRIPHQSRLYSYPRTSVSVVNLGYRRQVLKRKGFGYLIPQKEQESILGCVWDSCIFPQQNKDVDETRLTVMLGGVHHPHINDLSDADRISLSLDAMERHLGISVEPDCKMIWNAAHAIPQYEIGYDQEKLAFLERVRNISMRLVLSGNAFTGVSVNDCIAENNKMAQEFSLSNHV